MNIVTKWNGKMQFTATGTEGHNVIMDAAEEVGGENQGIRPKQLVVAGLAGCSSMDVISILRKMKVEPEAYRVEIEVQQTEDHPKVFSKIHMKYIVKGDVPEDKLKKAIDLSHDKYCGVSAMLGKTAEITYEYIYE